MGPTINLFDQITKLGVKPLYNYNLTEILNTSGPPDELYLMSTDENSGPEFVNKTWVYDFKVIFYYFVGQTWDSKDES